MRLTAQNNSARRTAGVRAQGTARRHLHRPETYCPGDLEPGLMLLAAQAITLTVLYVPFSAPGKAWLDLVR